MTVSRVALALLGVLALIFGINLVSATSGFVTAYDAYDAVRLELTDLQYASPDEPVRTIVTIVNPSSTTVEILAIELKLDAGFRRVGGGELRPPKPLTAEEAATFTLSPGEAQTFTVILNIDDRTYVRDRVAEWIEWSVTGRFQVRLDKGLDPEWIPT